MKLNIIGAGFGRTGTESLKKAIEILSLGPCYHMFEVDKHFDHVAVWQSKISGNNIDWDTIYAEYASAVDWPTCTFYLELFRKYPESKVILTIRDPEQWYESIKKTVFRAIREREGNLSEQTKAKREMSYKLISEKTFFNRLDDKDFCIDIFNSHIEKVKSDIPKRSLLIYDISDEWNPLCSFLGVDVPKQEFPKSNMSNDFEKRVFSNGINGVILDLSLSS
ncbi:MAG: sulfotransferase family protein [Methylobacter sp.]|nr:MAG: sulfotransferase family protein [Methylobacter sp.]